jgi:hypothetical protein
VTEEEIRRRVTWERLSASPGALTMLERMNAEIDVRDVLATIRVPTLVSARMRGRTASCKCLAAEARPQPGGELESVSPAARLSTTIHRRLQSFCVRLGGSTITVSPGSSSGGVRSGPTSGVAAPKRA